jgi:hypothetical protein
MPPHVRVDEGQDGEDLQAVEPHGGPEDYLGGVVKLREVPLCQVATGVKRVEIPVKERQDSASNLGR